jgi:polysaccharide biosynthesis protein PslG
MKISTFVASAICAVLVSVLLMTPGARAQYIAQSPEYGASAFIFGVPETTARDLNTLTSSGFGWVKMMVPWRSVEPSCKSCLDWSELDRAVSEANAAGVKVLARIDFSPSWAAEFQTDNSPPGNPEDFVDFMNRLVDRYRTDSAIGRIHAVQIWNEPNLTRDWGEQPISYRTAREYAYLLKETYKSIKQVDPNITVVTAGLSPTGTMDERAAPDDVYLEWLFQAGIKGYYDVLGLHAAGYGSPPETEVLSVPAFDQPAFYFRRVEQLRAIQERYGDGDKQVWLLEFGWTTDKVNPAYSWFAVTPAQQADYIVRAYNFARANWSPWIGVMFLWTLNDPRWSPANEQYWWAINEPDGTPRPALTRFKEARASGELP